MFKYIRLKSMFESKNCKITVEANGIQNSVKNENMYIKYIL